MTPDISGTWHGVLNTGAFKVMLILELTCRGGEGMATVRSPNFRDVDQPMVWRGDQLTIRAPNLAVTLELSLDGAAARLTGRCIGTESYPIVFLRGQPAGKPRLVRAQTPTPPFDYETQDVSFTAADGSRLAGTLTTPMVRPPRGAVVLSTWHGRMDRDERAYGHRPFAIWADALTQAGFATFRYDKRGAGESSGDFDSATTGDFAADLAQALAFVRAQPGVDPARVGLLGHSEGAHISADVAAADGGVAFCVLLTPSGVHEEETFDTELFRAVEAVGGIPLHPERTIALLRELSCAGREAASAREAVEQTRLILEREAAAGRFPAERVTQRSHMYGSPWLRYWLGYDQTASLRALTCPTLVVFAGSDLQTPPRYHAPKVRAALAGNAFARTVELPGLNHLLQTAVTGAPSEYGDIAESLAPVAVTAVRDWLTEVMTGGA